MADKGEGQEGKGAGEDSGIDVNELATTVKGLAEAVTGMHGNIKTLSEGFENFSKTQNQGKDGDGDGDDGTLDVDLETASRTDLVNHIMSQVTKVVEDVVKPVKEKAEEVDTKVDTGNVKAMVENMRKGSHPDIDEWGNELKEVLKESPGLSLKRAIKIAKDENPEKAEKLKTEYAEKKEDAQKKEQERRKKERKNYGGLTPSSSRTERSTRMSQKEAGEAAWEEITNSLEDPSILDNTS